jgi:branched-subunit amino acid aminotransferase/4-amino-4-deoxychorismate lyase
MRPKNMVYLNGKFIPERQAELSVLGPGFLYGWGLFETMRAYRNRIVYLSQHLERLKRSCKLIKMPYPPAAAELKGIIKKAIKINGLKDAYIRLTLWKSSAATDILIIAKKYQPYSPGKYREGFSACICRFRQNENSFFTRIKSTNYLFFRLAYLEAKNKGFDEAVILNNRGYITEGSRSNIFFVKGKKLFTPSLECGGLEGITRRFILSLAKKYKIKIQEGNFTIPDLYAADEAFLTNSLMGVMPLVSLEKKRIGKGARNFVFTRFFGKKYNFYLKHGK